MEFTPIEDHDFDMEMHEVLQPIYPDLTPPSPASYPLGFLEPTMVQELMNGQLARAFAE